MVAATLYSDPTCPYGYSTSPTLRVLEWRYGDQLEWRLALTVLLEDASPLESAGFTPVRMAVHHAALRRYGMPFAPVPKLRIPASARACRAVHAARLIAPGSEWAAFRALQFTNFTTPELVDDDATIRAALAAWTDLDPDAVLAALDSPEVTEAYERDKAEARTAAGSAAELQGKTSKDGDRVRYTAGTVAFEADGRRAVVGGYQPLEAYDVTVANMAPSLERRSAPDSPVPLLERFPGGLTTQEVAALLSDPPDRAAAEAALLELVATGEATRTPLGDDALWSKGSDPSGV
jgi:predicted DsbA family dithiol-disulfide isomerase